jgi:hypothetical protein
MTVYAPVCTCHIPGITGCTKHTWPTPPNDELLVLAYKISEGEDPYADEDAARVAAAVLELTRR